MKRSAITLISMLTVLLAAGSVPAEEAVHLLDGSIIRGRVISLDADNLIMSTAFSDELSIVRDKIAAIVLDEGAESRFTALTAGRWSSGAGESVEAEPVYEGNGSLEISFTGRDVRSSVRFARSGDRERLTDVNDIQLLIYIDDELAFERVDEKIDKEFQKGKLYYLRNVCNLEPVAIELPAGKHDLRIVVSNRFELLASGDEQGDLISADLLVEEVMVRPDGVTRMVVKGIGSRFGYGDFKMELLSSR